MWLSQNKNKANFGESTNNCTYKKGHGGKFFQHRRKGKEEQFDSNNQNSKGAERSENGSPKQHHYCKRYSHIDRYCCLKQKQAKFFKEKKKE